MSDVSSKELYEFKKTIKELANKRGRGTELVSVYIPPDKQLSDVAKHMIDEKGQSANIKSKQTRKNVQSAIEVILQRVRMFKKAPDNGLVLFVGMIPKGGPGTEKMETYVFEPPEPVTTYWYICDNTFFLEPLEYMIEERETYGIAVIDRNEATIATLKGKHINILVHLTSGVPGKHKAGGQSQRRFDRVIDGLAHEFKKRVGEHMNESLLPLKGDLKGIIVGGPGFTKEEFINGDYLQYELKDKVKATVDTSYTGEPGIREVIDKATSEGIFEGFDIMREKELYERFEKELVKDKGLCAYGEKEVMNCLIMGAVDTLLISEDLTSIKSSLNCNCGYTEDVTFKTQIEANSFEKECPKCGESLRPEETDLLVDHLVEVAEAVNTKVEFISTDTEEGAKLFRAFGGIAAILRYYVGN